MPTPINLSQDSKYSIQGRIVTMKDDIPVIDDGIVYIDGDTITAVLPSSANAPVGFYKTETLKTGGTVYPGMIELHNHLCYNTIPQWLVPKKYSNRDQWRRHPDYRTKITGPVKVLGSTEWHASALAKYVECKCLLSGTTTSQGITLQSNNGIKKYFKGVIRNVEQPMLKKLKSAKTRIADVESSKLEKFKNRLKNSSCLLLHLSEGTDASARKHFTDLFDEQNGNWAISNRLACIHANGLEPSDLKVMKNHNGSIIWSPLSNFMLYGGSLKIQAAKEEGILLALGSDWSPSGSKNLLCELKVAKILSDFHGTVFSDKELVEMTTINPAKILQWDGLLGTIGPGKIADLLVIAEQQDDVYKHFINATETEVSAVIIGGVPRCGTESFMKNFVGNFEKVKVNSKITRLLNIKNDKDNPFPDLTLKEAIERLQVGLSNMSSVVMGLYDGSIGFITGIDDNGQSAQWNIIPDEMDLPDSNVRLNLGANIEAEDFFSNSIAELADIAGDTPPLELDDLLIAGQKRFLEDLVKQKNVIKEIKEQLPPFYGITIPIPPDDAGIREVKSQEILREAEDINILKKLKGQLTKENMLLIIRQAIFLLENAYVHMSLKQRMHAANPIPRLRVLEYQIENDIDPRYHDEFEFHKEMITIFNSLRDLHTHYSLPFPYRDKYAFLPFFIEECFEDNEPVYILSRLLSNKKNEGLKEGCQILYWNGIPIRRAIQINAEQNAGSNISAQFARGIDSLTFRPLSRVLPPEEEWVELVYLDENGNRHTAEFSWQIGNVSSNAESWFSPKNALGSEIGFGFDHLTLFIQGVKKLFFANDIVKSNEQREDYYQSNLPGLFRARKLKNGIGYLRIFSFYYEDEKIFINEIIEILKWMGDETKGIIIDVRGNGGGNILASEGTLQLFSPRRINLHRSQFIDTQLTRLICKNHSPSKAWNLNLSPWNDSFNKLKQTGEQYSLAFPISDAKKMEGIKRVFFGKVVLIVDALCYSATDIFISGFKDHELGTIIGISDNIGAGGANVWTYQILQYLTMDEKTRKSASFPPLPCGASFRVAIRRLLKEEKDRGLLLEDIGVAIDKRYRMTKKDILSENADLIDYACEILKEN